jgi:para-nitrobenzyl esterase
MKTSVVLIILFAAIAGRAADSNPTVKVTGGQIRGEILRQGGAVFKGIPYAQPPVGDLRWREPMPVKPWTGVREATAFGPICAQFVGALIPNAAQSSKEDCLYLNVWTSELPSKSRRPVMLWIPGGGNVGGASSQTLYDGESLARHGVVLVSINYRLGSFGFFSHPALTRESPHHASGNQGILDQIAALKWVRDNVASFGGDPDNVTIFGNSAGSLDASVLMTSPLSKGSFRQVIAESGSVVLVGNPRTLQQAEQRGEALAAGWKIPPGASAKSLRSVSAADILKAEPDYLTDMLRAFPNLGITVDGYVVPERPAEVFATGKEHRVALLHGNTSSDQVPGSSPPKDLKMAVAEAYEPIAQRALKLYGGSPDPLYRTSADQWATDTSYRCSAVLQLAWHAAAGNPSFEYEFARVPPGREAIGAIHGTELTYVFGTLDRPLVIPGFPPQGATAIDKQISEAMQQYWTNFAKTGNPNGGQLPVWPKFDASSRAYIHFTDAGPIAKQGLRRPFCDLFIENVKRLMPR